MKFGDLIHDCVWKKHYSFSGNRKIFIYPITFYFKYILFIDEIIKY